MFIVLLFQGGLGGIIICKTKNAKFTQENGTSQPADAEYHYAMRTHGVFFQVEKLDCQITPAPYSWLGHKDFRRFARKTMGKKDFRENINLKKMVAEDLARRKAPGVGSYITPPPLWAIAIYFYLAYNILRHYN